jgi:hypothetical protein
MQIIGFPSAGQTAGWDFRSKGIVKKAEDWFSGEIGFSQFFLLHCLSPSLPYLTNYNTRKRSFF